MRARTIVLLVAILLVAGFAALNWSEFMRPSQLSFGAFITEAPLGMIMLTLLVVALGAFLLASAVMRTETLVESHHHHKTLEQQRNLADKAEASRFTELRQHLDLRLREIENRLDAHLRALPRTDPLRDPVPPVRDPLWREGDPPLRTDPHRPDLAGRERV